MFLSLPSLERNLISHFDQIRVFGLSAYHKNCRSRRQLLTFFLPRTPLWTARGRPVLTRCFPEFSYTPIPIRSQRQRSHIAKKSNNSPSFLHHFPFISQMKQHSFQHSHRQTRTTPSVENQRNGVPLAAGILSYQIKSRHTFRKEYTPTYLKASFRVFTYRGLVILGWHSSSSLFCSRSIFLAMGQKHQPGRKLVE